MTSWEEDALFAQYNWQKNLIARQWEGPRGHLIDFDEVVRVSQDPEGERMLVNVIITFGEGKE